MYPVKDEDAVPADDAKADGELRGIANSAMQNAPAQPGVPTQDGATRMGNTVSSAVPPGRKSHKTNLNRMA